MKLNDADFAQEIDLFKNFCVAYANLVPAAAHLQEKRRPFHEIDAHLTKTTDKHCIEEAFFLISML